MIVHIPETEGTQTRWLDTTGDQSLYPGVSNFLANQNVLIVNGEGGSLEKFPSLGPNSATINIDFYADSETQSRAEVEFLFEGDLESNLRSWWLHSTDKENALNQYLATLYSTTDSIRAEVKSSTDLWFPATIESTFTFDSPAQNENHSFAVSITQALRMFSSLSQLPLPETKQTRFYDPYPYELHMNFRVHGDKHSSPILIQSSDAHNTPFFDLEYTSKTSDTNYQLSIHFKKPALNLSQKEYEQYYKTIKKIEDENAWLVKLIDNTGTEKAVAIDTLKNEKGEDSLEFLIAKTRQLLEDGQFSDALIPAQKAVSLTDRNGEAWYILGMAQGFNAMIEESSTSFQKAEELGYIP